MGYLARDLTKEEVFYTSAIEKVHKKSTSFTIEQWNKFEIAWR
jgi:hypothetical protein